MIMVDFEVVIRAPASEVFEFVTNAENNSAWVGFAISARKLSCEPIGLGTRFSETGAVLGIRIPLVWEITEFEPDKRMKGETVAGPAKFWGEYILETVTPGTRLRKLGGIQLGGLLRLADPLLAGIFQQALKEDMGRLRRLLELRQVNPIG